MEGRYNNADARRAREMVRRIARQFGDPNAGQEYRDPYARNAFAVRETVFRARSNDHVAGGLR
ncbi:MAG: hypothetical protein HYT06_00585 [Candidatus Levybacteria bacterium]|nr:hypothetical protein [Candidatus Levybacteria bacterium]